jgi:DcaP outer membrane protein
MKPVCIVHQGRPISATLLLAAMVLSGFNAAWAESQPAPKPDVQRLENKLEELEKEMLELKQQISVLRQSEDSKPEQAIQQPPSQKAPPIQADEVSAQIPIEEFENQPLLTKQGTIVDLYGFVMLDSGYDFGTNDPNWFDVVRPSKLNAFPGKFAPDGKVWFGVRQTRFGVKTATATAWGDLTTRFEFELFGTGVDAGQTTFRLRQAYAELGAIGAGQTYSPFMDVDVFPNTIEYWGPNGMVFYRNVQLRWMPLRGDRTKLTLAVERPGATADQGQYSDFIELQNVRPRFNLPDISGNIRFIRDKGYLQVAGIFRKISWVDVAPSTYNLSGTAYGWGVNVSSNLKLTSSDVGKFSVVYGHAIGNYMNDAPVDIGVQANPGNPLAPVKGVPLPVFGGVAFIDHTWSPRFSSSIGYSIVNIENSDGDLPTAFHQGGYALANLLFYPVKPVMIGGEFQFGRRLDFRSGYNVNDYRLQFSFRYDWAKTFGLDVAR